MLFLRFNFFKTLYLLGLTVFKIRYSMLKNKENPVFIGSQSVFNCKTGETNYLIKQNNLGFTCNSGEIYALAEIFNSICKIQNTDYQQIKQNCRNFYEKKFSSTKRKEEIFSIIEINTL